MRIGVIATDNLTGIGRVFQRTLGELVRLAPEHSFELLVPSTAVQVPAFPGVNRHSFSAPPFPVLGRYLRDRTLRGLAKRLKLDVLHDLSNGGLPLGSTHALKVETVHDTVPYVYPDVVPASVRRWYRFTIPKVLRGADVIITVGNVVKRDLVRFLGISAAKIRVVQNGVDDRFKPLGGQGDLRRRLGFPFPFVLFLGNVIPKRNVHRLVRAFASIATRHPDTKLVLAGPYDSGLPYVVELRRHIKDGGLDEKVFLTGFVEDDLLPWLYNAAEAFAYVPFYEGFCLPPLEAMACGIPVVVSDTPPLREVVEDGGLFVDPFSIEDIADGLEAALFDGATRRELGTRGIGRAKSLSWEKTARGVLAVYDEARSAPGP